MSHCSPGICQVGAVSWTGPIICHLWGSCFLAQGYQYSVLPIKSITQGPPEIPLLWTAFSDLTPWPGPCHFTPGIYLFVPWLTCLIPATQELPHFSPHPSLCSARTVPDYCFSSAAGHLSLFIEVCLLLAPEMPSEAKAGPSLYVLTVL